MGADRKAPEPISESGLAYFGFLAEMGITKHLGSHNVTLELVELCQVAEGKYVLDVGCGVGATPAFLARSLGCRVVGVDITPKMIERARARVENEGVAGLVELRVADALALPFEDGTFDAVLCESVVAFLEDRQRAVDEFARVCKPGGYVGMTEATLLKPTSDPEFLAYMARVAGIQGGMLPREVWAQHLHSAGLEDVVARAHKLDMRKEAKARLRRYRARDMLAALIRLPKMWFGDADAKAFLKATFGGVKHVRKETFEYMGYGTYVGRRRAPSQED
jgi:ubiquinone/menaquinone biosynthesis C-methylase UbiE